jgi:hypothetical protein
VLIGAKGTGKGFNDAHRLVSSQAGVVPTSWNQVGGKKVRYLWHGRWVDGIAGDVERVMVEEGSDGRHRNMQSDTFCEIWLPERGVHAHCHKLNLLKVTGETDA